MSQSIGTTDPDALMREVAAADFLGFSPRTLQAWRHRGIGPPYCQTGRAVRYRRQDLVAFVEANLVGVENGLPPTDNGGSEHKAKAGPDAPKFTAAEASRPESTCCDRPGGRR